MREIRETDSLDLAGDNQEVNSHLSPRNLPHTGLYRGKSALWINPPIVPAAQQCSCCGGNRGPKSWELPICLPCYDAYEGKRTDATIYIVVSIQGGFETHKFQRGHTKCPLRAQSE